MFDIYEEMKNLIPFKQCKKYRIDGEFVIVCGADQKVHYLNSTAGDIFKMCDGKNKISSIFDFMKSNYDAEEEVLKNDIIETIRDFQWQNIVILKEEKI